MHVFTAHYLSWRFLTLVDLIGPLGELWVVLPLAAVLVAWCLVSGERRGAVAIFLSTTGVFAIVVFIKLVAVLVGPPWRPHWEYVSNLFPSGHAAMGAVVYGALALCVARAAPRWGFVCGALVAVLLVLISIQRVASGSHPWVDVLGGAAMGVVGLSALVRLWPKGRMRAEGLPVVAVAVALIVVAFYGRSVPSSQILAHASARIESAVGTFKTFSIGAR